MPTNICNHRYFTVAVTTFKHFRTLTKPLRDIIGGASAVASEESHSARVRSVLLLQNTYIYIYIYILYNVCYIYFSGITMSESSNTSNTHLQKRGHTSKSFSRPHIVSTCMWRVRPSSSLFTTNVPSVIRA